MQRERVLELNKISDEKNIPIQIYRLIAAYAVSYTRFNDLETREEKAFKIIKESLKKVDLKYLRQINLHDYSIRVYSRDIVKETMEELGIKDPRITYLEEIKKK